MHQSLTFSDPNKTYDVHVGSVWNELLRRLPDTHVVIVTDDNVLKLHGAKFPQVPVISLPPGEEHKNSRTLWMLYERFLELELDRSGFILAIGGGVVCDIAGFAAATYMRGLPFGLVPTTLLAQVDAAIGGKNGINFKTYKNIIGTFSQPDFVFCESSFLQSLPLEEFLCGLAECIKHGLIADISLFEYIVEQQRDILCRNSSVLNRLIFDSIRIKTSIASQDVSEWGLRKILNFGHTIGHALEHLQKIKHGQAISIGMSVAAKLSKKMGYLTSQQAAEIPTVLKKFGLPIALEENPVELLHAIRKDKKKGGDTIDFILLKQPGQAIIYPMSFTELEERLYDLS